MKLEKISDNQIRCIIDRDDLEERELNIAELIQRSDKAKEFFHDMMQQAAEELDFEVNNFPIMVEAAPVSNDCIIFVITRVDDPEEFKKKLPDLSNVAHLNIEIHGNEEDLPFDMEEDMDLLDMELDGENVSQDIDEKELDESQEPPFDILRMFNETISKAKKEVAKKQEEEAQQKTGIQIYCFDRLNDVITLSAALAPFFDGESHLYKDMVDSTYYFILLQDDSSAETFTRACTISSDYGHMIDAGYNSLSYFIEHFRAIRIGDAIAYLNELN